MPCVDHMQIHTYTTHDGERGENVCLPSIQRIAATIAKAKAIQETAIHGAGVASKRIHAMRPVAAQLYPARPTSFCSAFGIWILFAIQYAPATTGSAANACSGIECQVRAPERSVVTATARAKPLSK